MAGCKTQESKKKARIFINCILLGATRISFYKKPDDGATKRLRDLQYRSFLL